MKRSVLAFVLLAAPMFAQIPAPSPVPDQSAAARAAAGCGPSAIVYEVKTDKHQHPTAQPEAGKALIYIIGDIAINRPLTRVGIDGDWVGANYAESYFFFPTSPGDHRLCVNWQSIHGRISKLGSALTFTAEAGKAYYFRLANDDKKEHELGMTLEAMDPAQAQFLISSTAFATSHPKK
jgi:hypothetical protein